MGTGLAAQANPPDLAPSMQASPGVLRQNLPGHLTAYVGQAEVAAGVVEGEAFMALKGNGEAIREVRVASILTVPELEVPSLANMDGLVVGQGKFNGNIKTSPHR